MGIKKIARPLNKTKNLFIHWLNRNNAEHIDVFNGKPHEDWDYYINITAFIKKDYYSVTFMMWKGNIKISYSDDNNNYDRLSIEEFTKMLAL